MTTIRSVGSSVTAAAAVTGLLRDTWPAMLPWPAVNLHAVFGMLLCSVVIVELRCAAVMDLTPDVARALLRRLSRMIYLLLYAVVGVDLILRMLATSPASILQPPDNLRDYLAYGVAALLAIRVLAALNARQPPAIQMSPQLAALEGSAAPR